MFRTPDERCPGDLLAKIAAPYYESVGVELFLRFQMSRTPDIKCPGKIRCPGGLLVKIAASYHESVGVELFLRDLGCLRHRTS